MDSELAYKQQLRGDQLAMKDKQNNKTTTTHWEEAPSMFQETHQIVKRSNKLFKITSIPLPHTHTHQVYFTGLHATDKVNAEESITSGREQMAEFKYGWPTSFNKTRHWPIMWDWWLQTRRASSWMESQYMILNLSTLESYVSISIEILIPQMSSPTNFPQCQHHQLMREVLCVLNRRKSWRRNSQVETINSAFTRHCHPERGSQRSPQ